MTKPDKSCHSLFVFTKVLETMYPYKELFLIWIPDLYSELINIKYLFFKYTTQKIYAVLISFSLLFCLHVPVTEALS